MLDAGTSLAVQWLVLRAFTAEGVNSIPGLELRSYKPCGTAKKKKTPFKQSSDRLEEARQGE